MRSYHRFKRIPVNIKLYWRCLNCSANFEWPLIKARKYCNRKCKDQYYRKLFPL